MKKIMTLGCGVLCAASALALMEPATPESQGVSSAAIMKFIDACEKNYDAGKQGAMHGFVIVRHGKVIAEGSWKPFDTLNETHMLYSHSKSFTSTAIGFLVYEGKLDLDERVVEIFSNDAPIKVSENLAQLRVRDLLTMNVGKQDHLLRDGGNWVKEFLSKDFVCRPGTHFQYDSDATYMLAAIVELRTGKHLMDYLKEKMFDKIGIEKAWTTTSPQGIACGGWGMNMTTRELARFGQLYLNRGQWEGEQVLPAEWVDLATTRHTWSGWQNVGVQALGSGSDWEQGYGFQFWRCTHGAYRADGAAGQYTVVLPAEDMVVSMHAGANDFQKELNLLWDNLLPGLSKTPLKEDAVTYGQLQNRLANLKIVPDKMRQSAELPIALLGRYEFAPTEHGLKSMEFVRHGDDTIHCKLFTACGEQEFNAGVWPKWCKGDKIRIDPEHWEKLGGYIGEHVVAATCCGDQQGRFVFRAYFTADTGYLDIVITPDRKLTGLFWGMGGCHIKSK